MDGWVDYLHFSFFGEHVLFHSLRVDSFWTFFLSSVLVAVICLVESKKFRPRWASRSQVACASWDASLYGLVTLFRVLYMLVIMSYQAGIIAVAVISLSVGQFLVEYHLNHARAADSDRLVNEPLLGNPVEHLGSNLARADAAALELGIAGDTELVAGNRLPDDGAWENGKGSIVARELFGKNSQS
ncbi:hypothetical protein EDD16DRAFT_830044 [Pisolithus croceorrhizus]|nr:hypothetical protein EDD16DRAFT_830044 [Pisolithus croceorrhizus]